MYIRYEITISVIWSYQKGNEEEEETISATIVIPEFVHDQDKDEYVFEIESASQNQKLESTLYQS